MSPEQSKQHFRIPIEPLTAQAFAPYGTVVENPLRDPSSWPSIPESTTANQGTARKYADISHLTNAYSVSPSKKPAQPRISMFVCSPRPLDTSLPAGGTTLPYPGQTKTLPIAVLERHPYTTQTFVPLGLSPSDRNTAFIVVVAPTLPTRSASGGRRDHRQPPYPVSTRGRPKKRSTLSSIFRRARPEPFTNNYDPSGPAGQQPAATADADDAKVITANTPLELKEGGNLLPSFSSLAQYRSRPTALTESLFRPRGSGMPDLGKARAFIAHGGQGVTYGPGTWHAPIAVVGAEEVSFVVAQWGNGVAAEDCQEVEVRGLLTGTMTGGGGTFREVEGEEEEKGGARLEVVVEEGLFGARTGGGVAVRAKL